MKVSMTKTAMADYINATESKKSSHRQFNDVTFMVGQKRVARKMMPYKAEKTSQKSYKQ